MRLNEKKQKKLAKKHLDESIRYNKLPKSDRLYLAKIFVAKSLEEKSYSSALFCSNLILKNYPEEESYYFLSAQLYSRQSNWKKAKDMCHDGLKYNNNKTSYIKLCEVVYKKNSLYSLALKSNE